MRRCVALLLAMAALAGCGLGPGKERGGDGATLRVTRDFGSRLLSASSVRKVREDGTVMRLLRSKNDVRTRFGGRFVQAIDGLSGRGATGSSDWFFYVNGLEADVGAGEYELSPGDVVQWDYRDWRNTMDVRAIVGAFPEPFLHGIEGKRRPVRVECEDAGSHACGEVKATLRGMGVPAAGATLGASGAEKSIRVVVAAWHSARALPTARVIEQGPRRSGVFARFRDGGRRLELLDGGGRVVRADGPDTGLVAAVRPRDDALLWLVTGGGRRGVDNAAAAFRRRALRDAFAVAAPPAGPEKLPLGEGS